MAEPTLQSTQRVHLVGIGGSGMSALARLLLGMGKQVSGSDATASTAVERLRGDGARVFAGHAAANVGDAEYVVRSSAVSVDNSEVQESLRRGLVVRKLAEAVGELTRDRSTVAVAGTHGKTTTTALTAWLLECGGVDPLALIGADVPHFPQGARVGAGPMVVEADEFDRRFLAYWPEVAVVTAIEADHLDYFRDLDEIRGAFQELVGRLPLEGRLVVCADDGCALSLHTKAQRDTYGFAADATWRVSDYAPQPRGSIFVLQNSGRTWTIESPLIGVHNAENATAAIAVADYFGVGLRASVEALKRFEAPRRRFEIKGRPREIVVVDDYGHHPTEVAAVLRAAREFAAGAVWVVFQPHTSNRTRALLDEFGRAFDDAQHVLVLPIYEPLGRTGGARDVSPQHVVERVQRAGHSDVRRVESFEDACTTVVAEAQPGDVVITMGAGDVTRLSDELVQALGA